MDIDNDKIGNLLAKLAIDEKNLARAQVAVDQSRKAKGSEKRRSRDQFLISIGGLFVIAGLMTTDLNIVLGALVQAKALESDQGRCRAWTRKGREALVQWQRKRADPTRLDPRSVDLRHAMVPAQKQLTKKLIIRGAVVEKAGLAHWPAATILGILLVIGRNLGDETRVTAWKRKGAEFRIAGRPPLRPHIVVTFGGRVPRPIAAQLRSLKLEFKRANRWFVGRADPATANAIARQAGGVVHVLKPGKRAPW